MRTLLGALCAVPMLALAHVAPAQAALVLPSGGIVCVEGDISACADVVNNVTVGIYDDLGPTKTLIRVSASAGFTGAVEAIYIRTAAIGSLDGVVSFPPGVVFSTTGAPPQLPGGDFMADIAVFADNPAPTNGVNAGENVDIVLNANPMDFVAGLLSKDALIGAHALSSGINNTSVSMVTCFGTACVPPGGEDPPTDIAEPASLALFGLAIGSLAATRRRRRGVFDFLKALTNRPAYA